MLNQKLGKFSIKPKFSQEYTVSDGTPKFHLVYWPISQTTHTPPLFHMT